MATRERLSSTASNSSYNSDSSSSYYGCSGSSAGISVTKARAAVDNGLSKSPKKTKPKTLFDDVKIILSRHDKKLLKLEKDLNLTISWLSSKFGFRLLTYGSTTYDELKRAEVVETHNASTNLDEITDNEELGVCPQAEDGLNSASTLDQYSTSQKEENFHMIDSGEDFYDEEELKIIPNVVQKPLEQNAQKEFIEEKSATVKPKKKRTVKPKTSSLLISDTDPQLPPQCDNCGKFLKDATSLRQHKQIHLNIRPFICPEPECGKSFRRKFHMQTHLLIHSGIKKHQCGYCGRLFLLQKDLVSHERIHTGERPFQCPECPKSFNLKSHLVMHSRTHSGEKPYKCEVCSKCFAQSNSLRLHKKKVHRQDGLNTTNTSEQGRPQSKKISKSLKQTKKTRRNKFESQTPSSQNATTPAKLPIYKTQRKSATKPKTDMLLNSSTSNVTPTIAILHHTPSTISPFEFFEQVSMEEQIVLPTSALNMLTSAPVLPELFDIHIPNTRY